MSKSCWFFVYAFMFSFLALMMGVALDSDETAPADIGCTKYFVEFDGLTYDQIQYKDIVSLTMLKNYDLIRQGKQEGLEFDEYYNGPANYKDIGKCHAYIYLTHPDYVLLTTNQQKIVFNLPSLEQTEQLYSTIRHEMEKRN